MKLINVILLVMLSGCASGIQLDQISDPSMPPIDQEEEGIDEVLEIASVPVLAEPEIEEIEQIVLTPDQICGDESQCSLWSEDNACGEGCQCNGHVALELNCEDGLDNDQDGDLDCDDTSCSCSPVCGGGCLSDGSQAEVCGGGMDADNDGAFSCCDADCTDHPQCTLCAGEEETCGDGCECDRHLPHESACGDGTDNDGDSYVDCEDNDCPCEVEV